METKAVRINPASLRGAYILPRLSLFALLAAATLRGTPSPPANTLPVNPTVTKGSVTYSQTNNTLKAAQTTSLAATTWSSFSIGKDAQVVIETPTANSISLNRVSGLESSKIAGRIISNGKVFISNPNGAIIAPGAKVETAAFLATTLDIEERNEGADLFRLHGTSNGEIRNEGNVIVSERGFIFVAAAKIVNRGTLSAQGGTVVLAAGQEIDLTLPGESGLTYTIKKGALDAMISNHEAILADGGVVMLTARAANDATTAVVNNTGAISARTVKSVGVKSTSSATKRPTWTACWTLPHPKQATAVSLKRRPKESGLQRIRKLTPQAERGPTGHG